MIEEGEIKEIMDTENKEENKGEKIETDTQAPEEDKWGKEDSLDQQKIDMQKIDELFDIKTRNMAHLVDIDKIKEKGK